MRIRTGHGPNDWDDKGEGYAGSIKLGGSLVCGTPRPAKPAGLTANQLKPDARPIRNGRPPVYQTEEERIEARRRSWRESARRAKERAA